MSIDLQTSGWVMVWWVWFQLRRPAWAPKAVAGLTVAYAAAISLKTALIDFDIASPEGPHAALLNALGFIVLVFMVALLVALALIVSAGIRKEGREGWWALLVVVTIAVEMFAPAFGLIRIGSFHGVVLRIWDVTDPILVGILVFLMLRRLLRSLDRQRQMALDVKQAQEVQQVILPEARLALPGLTIESEYRPAREVGGDFFQIIPHKTDGSLLIVAGDVTGKGLKAGMLVALLVGAIRTEEKHDTDPAGMLSTLNQRLIGRGDAQATCLALRIEADGSVTLANAGHMPPYLNGELLPMEGALPLGMIEGAEPSVMQFQLKRGDRLMLMSDGVAEATDANGHLFGFERVNELLRTATTAAEIASTAQAFGQEDDISVISVTRTAALESAAA
jgi:hypothetical protein